MNNDLNGLKPDHIIIDEMANVTVEMQKQMSDLVDAMHFSLYGTITGRISARVCSFCKVAKYAHQNNYNEHQYFDHPFFQNNLEYLEWVASK